MNLRLIHSSEIDRQKWDLLVSSQNNICAYGYSWYLDAACQQWSGLVLGEYEGIMPICWNQKFGIKYVYQPPFLQRMEWIGQKIENQEHIMKLLNKHFMYFDFKSNLPLSYNERTNYILNTNQSYDLMAKYFNTQTKRNLKGNALLFNIASPASLIEMYVAHTAPLIEGWKPDFETRLIQIVNAAFQFNKIEIISASLNDEIMAIAGFVTNGKRKSMVFSTTTTNGKSENAMGKLVNHFIQKEANSETIIDFEGSEIENIARFYKGFGAEREVYYHLKQLNLLSLTSISLKV
jgi:hypothetical protein